MGNQDYKSYPYMNEALSFEERAQDLVSRMTLEEKVSQLLYDAPAVERLGIPEYNWWNECLHGVARAGVATVFPQAIGMAATFDEKLLYKMACITADEARAKYHESVRQGDRDIYKGLTYWSPNVNIFRDPRWGRGHETYGEDPYLTARLGVAFVRGLQGDDPKYLKLVATGKHYAVHSGPEADRHHFDAVSNPKDMRETYLYAFRALVKEANVYSIMGAYNRTNGEPCCGSKTLLQDILRDEWGFDGYVVSDCWAVRDFHTNHKVTATAPESAAMAVNNGCELNCGNTYFHLLAAHEEGLITDETISRACYRLMLARMKLGMFDCDDHVPFTKVPYEFVDCNQNRAFALEVARKGVVLLKNANQILPLKKNLGSIAVIGPNADMRIDMIGNYAGTPSHYVTPVEGIRNAVSRATRVYYAEGCHIYNAKSEGLSQYRNDRLAEAVSAAQRADVAILFVGLSPKLEGEQGDTGNRDNASGDKNNIELPGNQLELIQKVAATGTPTIVVSISGSAVSLSWADQNVPAVLQAFYPGPEGGTAIADVLFGNVTPGGRLPVTFYHSTADLPEFTDYNMDNRTYRYFTGETLYPFGYGLSYTSFAYSELALATRQVYAGQDFKLRVDVTNTGHVTGDEVVQVYLKSLSTQYKVPLFKLAAVTRINDLKPGQTETVELVVKADEFALYDEDGTRFLLAGDFKVFVGGSQPDARSVQLTGVKPLEETIKMVGNRLELAP